MSDFKITGNPNPEVGKEEFYSVNTLLPKIEPYYPNHIPSPTYNNFEYPVTWEVYLLERGEWRKAKGNEKTGNIVSFTFLQRSLDRKGIRILAKRGEQIARLDIKSHPAEIPKIQSVELLDKNGKKPTQPLAYGQTLKARVHCLHMDRRTVHATLWEDDADGGGHDKQNEKNKAKTLPGIVRNGIADIDFILTPDFKKIANARNANEGKTHEYYVTAEIFQQEKVSSNNLNVNNSDYESESKKQPAKKTPPAETKGESKKDQKGIQPPAAGKKYDWVEEAFKIKPIFLPDPMDFTNSVMKVFVPDEEDEKKDKKKGECLKCNEDFKYDDILTIFPAASKNKSLADKLITEINLLRVKYKIDTCLRKAHLINQFGSETGFNTLIEEIDGYSVTTLKSLFGYFKRNPTEAETYKGNLYEIAIRAYGLRKVDKEEDIVSCVLTPGGKCNDLGNESKEEGYTYIGRGLIQLTGKYNYSQINKDFIKAFPGKGDLIKNPELLEEPKYAAMSAFSYWINNNLNIKADLGFKPANVDAITKIINKNLDASHYEKRRKTFVKAKEVYQLDKCKNITTKESTSTSVTIRLIRKWQTEKSTIGEFTIDDSDITGYILEEKGPDTTISGIEQRVPIGTYNLVWHNGTKFKNVLKLYNSDVSIDRAILIHSGNSAESTEGCLLPGSSKSLDWVSNSRDKLVEINEYVKSVGIENAKIIITQDYE
nr:DUF5675 family protein [uncultured Flavobacterium sp.]